MCRYVLRSGETARRVVLPRKIGHHVQLMWPKKQYHEREFAENHFAHRHFWLLTRQPRRRLRKCTKHDEVRAILSILIQRFTLCSNELEAVKMPRNLADAQNLGRVLSQYKDRYYTTVLAGVAVTYLLSESHLFHQLIF